MSKSPPAGLAQPIPSEPLEDHTSGSLTKELTRVEEANLAFYEAFSQRDIEAMARVWSKSPHVRCIHPGLELVVGWNDIRRSWVEIFRTMEDIEFELQDVHVEVAGRIAWVNLVSLVHLVTGEGEEFDASVVATNVFEHTDGQWLMVLHHSSNLGDDEDEDGEEDDDGMTFEGSNESN